MKWIAVVLLAASPALFAQRNASPTGFGRILFPGGTAPSGVGGVNYYGSMPFPGTAALPYSNQYNYGQPPAVNHNIHSPNYVVPYPVLYGGYYGGANYGAYGYYSATGSYNVPQAQTAQPVNIQQNYPPPGSYYGGSSSDQQQQPPVVIINQYFREQQGAPETSTSTPPAVETEPQPQPQPQQTRAAPSSNDQPMFLIAMKDHNIFTASAYWIEDDTLHYITTQGSENSASMDLVDRDLSRRLNRERNVAFGLPAN